MAIERRLKPRIIIYAPVALRLRDRIFDAQLMNLNPDGAQLELPAEAVNLLAKDRPADGSWPRTPLDLDPGSENDDSGVVECEVVFMRRLKQTLYVAGLKFVTPVPDPAAAVIAELIAKGKAALP